MNEAGVNSTVVAVVGRGTKSLNRVNSLLRSSGVISELGGIALGGVALTLLTFGETMTIVKFRPRPVSFFSSLACSESSK